MTIQSYKHFKDYTLTNEQDRREQLLAPGLLDNEELVPLPFWLCCSQTFLGIIRFQMPSLQICIEGPSIKRSERMKLTLRTNAGGWRSFKERCASLSIRSWSKEESRGMKVTMRRIRSKAILHPWKVTHNFPSSACLLSLYPQKT